MFVTGSRALFCSRYLRGESGKENNLSPNQNQVTPLSGPRLTFTAFLWLRARALQREAPLQRITDLLASVNLHIKQRLTSRGSYLKKKDIMQQETVRIYHSEFLTRIFREEKEGNLAGGAVCVLSHNISFFLFSLLNSFSLCVYFSVDSCPKKVK